MLKKSKIALNINHPSCELPTIYDSNIFFIQDKWDRDDITEHEYKRTNRLFTLKHKQIENMPNMLGEQGTFYLHRVILSFFDAAFKLNEFSRRYFKNVEEDRLSFNEIEKQALDHNVSHFNFNSLEVQTFLCTYYPTLDRIENKSNIAESEVLEALLAMNLNNILKKHGIETYQQNKDREFKISDYDGLILKMATNREIGMVMHNWRKLNNYNEVQFISTTSKILEFIVADLQKNSDGFRKDVHFEKLQSLISLVSENTKERKHFFGLFNEAEKLGFISRHGTSTDKKKLKEELHLFVYEGISTTNPQNVSDIRNRMFEDKILPNGSELNYLYDVWHYTTSLIVMLWFLGRKTI